MNKQTQRITQAGLFMALNVALNQTMQLSLIPHMAIPLFYIGFWLSGLLLPWPYAFIVCFTGNIISDAIMGWLNVSCFFYDLFGGFIGIAIALLKNRRLIMFGVVFILNWCMLAIDPLLMLVDLSVVDPFQEIGVAIANPIFAVIFYLLIVRVVRILETYHK